ncbi:hypothetical protein GCM10027569_70730 [Flindersiella endophytica]
MPTRPAADAAERPRPWRSRRDALGWLGVLGVTLVVALSWAPVLDAAYGDNHEGRVFARLALQIRNLDRMGLVGSHFGADWSPYTSFEESVTTYAHHPPLATLVSALFGLLPGDGEYQIRLGPYLLGVLAIPAAAWLLRALQVRWVPLLLALGLMAATGLFWIYGRMVFELGPILILAAAIAQLRRRPEPPGWLIGLACAAGVLSVLTGWLNVGFAAVLGLWLFAKRRFDRPTVLVGASMVGGLLVTLAFVVGLSGVTDLKAQTEFRTEGGGFTVREFVLQQWQWLTDLLPAWYLVLLPLGIVAGLLKRSTRFVTAASTLLSIGWIVGLPNGSFIHDYWIFPILVPGVVGMAALLNLIWVRLPSAVGAVAGVAGGGLLVAAFVGLVTGDQAKDYVTRPLDAGELVRTHGPASGQEEGWNVSFGAVRWLAYYWDIHPNRFRPDTAAKARPDDLVLLREDSIPVWLRGSEVLDHVEARNGIYFLVRASDLDRAMVKP